MTPLVTALVLVSAFLHPLWNLLFKRETDNGALFVVFVASFILFSLTWNVLTGANMLAAWHVWPLILLSAGGQILYGTMLMATLRHGDLSAYYPIIRASPLFVVLVNMLVLGQHYPLVILAGIAMVLTGSFLLLYRRGVHMPGRPALLAMALLSMTGSGLYSLADARIMQVTGPGVLLFWVESLCLPVYLWLYFHTGHAQNPQRGWAALARIGFRGLGVAAIAFSSYMMILAAYSLGGEVAAVTSVRQASIPLSVLLGGLLLREDALRRRLLASLILATGIILIVTA